MFVKIEFIDDEKFENDFFFKFCENVVVDDNYEIGIPFYSQKENDWQYLFISQKLVENTV